MYIKCAYFAPKFAPKFAQNLQKNNGKKRFLAVKNGYLNKNRPPKTTVYKVFKKLINV
jgi:hypothetical protein